MPVSRRYPRLVLLIGALAAMLLGSTTVPAAAEDVENRVAFTFTDRKITESSGLVVRGPLAFTINDSGDGPRLYSVDTATGDTVATTTYSSDVVEDVEALAPGQGADVWVGDIGDNAEERDSLNVYRVVPLGGARQQRNAVEGDRKAIEETVEAEKFSLVYPDSAHDAETLLVHPDTGRLHVVTKSVTGGTVYAAPDTLDPESANRLQEVVDVPGLVTDGSFLPDGDHILLRSYGRAAIYTFPELRLVGPLDLPAQKQGEGVAVDRDGSVFLSSEGIFSDVLAIVLPDEVIEALGNPKLDKTLPAKPPPKPEIPASEPVSTGGDAVLWVVVGIVGVALAGWLAIAVARRRSRRRW